MVFLILSVCIAGGIGTQRSATFFISMYAFATFYGAHWGTYVTGRLRFYKLDVTEAHFIVIIACLVTAACGVAIWSTTYTVSTKC